MTIDELCRAIEEWIWKNTTFEGFCKYTGHKLLVDIRPRWDQFQDEYGFDLELSYRKGITSPETIEIDGKVYNVIADWPSWAPIGDPDKWPRVLRHAAKDVVNLYRSLYLEKWFSGKEIDGYRISSVIFSRGGWPDMAYGTVFKLEFEVRSKLFEIYYYPATNEVGFIDNGLLVPAHMWVEQLLKLNALRRDFLSLIDQGIRKTNSTVVF